MPTDSASAQSPSASGGAEPPPLRLLVLPLVVASALAAALFTYAPWRFIVWSRELIDQGAGWYAAAPVLIAVLSVIGGVRWFGLITFSLLGYRKLLRHDPPSVDDLPRVSVFVPAFNEEQTIQPALESLLKLDYPDYEVIVVDDGSSDRTYEMAKPFEGRHGAAGVRVLRKPNGGKWSAHNHAFTRSTGELILCLDADSRIDPHSLGLMVSHLTDPGVAGVSGQIRVRNRVNVLTRLQAVEYLIANGALRMGQSYTGTVLVVPGPIGLFRRSYLEEVFLRFGQSERGLKPGEIAGPVEGDTFAEDFDLSVAVLSLGGRIVYEPRAISHTTAPATFFSLLNQRYRWARGTIQVLRKFFRRCRAQADLRRPRLVAWLLATYVIELVLLPFAYFFGISFLLFMLATVTDLRPLLLWTGAFLAMNLNAAAYFTAIHGDRLTLLRVVPLFDLYHGFVLNSAWAIAVFDEVRGARMRW